MASDPEAPLDLLWKEYSQAFRDFDDMTLARWLAQTLGQLEGKAWRLSHPLLGAYRLAAQLGQERHIWLQRLAHPPPAYSESPCCRAPLLPLLTRDVRETGLVCQHCSETLVPFDELPSVLNPEQGFLVTANNRTAPDDYPFPLSDDDQRKKAGDYDRAYEKAADKAEALLARGGRELAPRLLEFYPAVVWEDQDDCLEVRPEDVTV